MKRKTGVTMVTLIITISILAILAGISIYTVISENNKTVEKTKELKKEIDDKNIEEKIVSIGTYIIERENKLTMYDFANKLKNELTNRKIIKTTFNIQDISGNYRVQIYDKSGNIVYDKKIIDIFRKKEGVTLLVLVTIIILFLIVLSVTLPPIVMNNGVISNTKTGVSEYEKQEIDGILKVLSFEILANNNVSELTNNIFKTKLEQKIFKYNEDKEEKSKIKIVITSIKYDIRKDIIINYTKDDKSFKTVIERY